jgi:hypothetical protein
MNEQLEKLATQANDQTGNQFDSNFMPMYAHTPMDAFLKKFAELIVAECMDAVKTTAVGYTKHTTDDAETLEVRVEGALEVGNEIARRFKDIGV